MSEEKTEYEKALDRIMLLQKIEANLRAQLAEAKKEASYEVAAEWRDKYKAARRHFERAVRKLVLYMYEYESKQLVDSYMSEIIEECEREGKQ